MDQNTEKRQSEKNDKVGEYLVHHLDNMLFDELSDEYLKKAEMTEILKGVPVPFKAEQITGGATSTLMIASNMAYVIVEDIGGYGSATLLTLMNLEYPNLYYDDPTLKKYTSQNEATPTQVTVDGLPGFHSSSVRFQMLSKFANLVTTNQFKIRSKRVCTELDTWIFKNGRIDHKDGCHDDTLTCLAMGLFVMEYSLARQIKAKSLDNTMLKAMIQVNSRINTEPKKVNKPLNNNNPIQMFAAKGSRDSMTEKYRANMWLLS